MEKRHCTEQSYFEAVQNEAFHEGLQAGAKNGSLRKRGCRRAWQRAEGSAPASPSLSQTAAQAYKVNVINPFHLALWVINMMGKHR